MKDDKVRTEYDKSLNHIIDLQEKINEALVDDSFKTEDFKALKDELSKEKTNRNTLFEELHVTDENKDDDGNDDGNDSEDKCKPQDALVALNKAINKMDKNLADKIDDVCNKLGEAINNLNSKSDKAETKDEDKSEHEEPKKATTSDSVKNLFDELEKTFNE